MMIFVTCKHLRLHDMEVFGLCEEDDMSICVVNSARIEQASRRHNAARWPGMQLCCLPVCPKTRNESIHFLLGGPATLPHTQLPTNVEVIK